MIAKGHHALRIVEEPEMRKLIQLVSNCPGYQLPSRKTVSTNLMSNVHQELQSEARIKIKAAVALSLTTDGWTSSNNESYIAVTAHFIDDETKLCSILLTCEAFNDRHTSENLCDFLRNVMIDWDILHKVTAVVSDNASNIINAVKLGKWR
ncbi:E3 SUMO-protein ligase ZBED1-like [Microplitis demolitor]|nr:E3 SUMO-protein ligase ZBED1-like [Microplitis demolitor]